MAARPRRTNLERTQEMRQRLLDAAVDSLFEVGFARTTTLEVAKRAGVSRGAQLHHFPTKNDLVTAALDHLFKIRQVEFRELYDRLPPGADVTDEVVDYLWAMLSGPTFYAWLELLVAARTDPELHDSVSRLARRSDEEIEALFVELFEPPPGLGPMIKVAGALLFSVLEGMATERIAHGADPRFDGALALVKTGLRSLAAGAGFELRTRGPKRRVKKGKER